jgi:hypothetical protein
MSLMLQCSLLRSLALYEIGLQTVIGAKSYNVTTLTFNEKNWGLLLVGGTATHIKAIAICSDSGSLCCLCKRSLLSC